MPTFLWVNERSIHFYFLVVPLVGRRRSKCHLLVLAGSRRRRIGFVDVRCTNHVEMALVFAGGYDGGYLYRNFSNEREGRQQTFSHNPAPPHPPQCCHREGSLQQPERLPFVISFFRMRILQGYSSNHACIVSQGNGSAVQLLCGSCDKLGDSFMCLPQKTVQTYIHPFSSLSNFC